MPSLYIHGPVLMVAFGSLPHRTSSVPSLLRWFCQIALGIIGMPAVVVRNKP